MSAATRHLSVIGRLSLVVATCATLQILPACSGDSSSSNADFGASTEPFVATPTDPAVSVAPTSTAAKLDIEEGEPQVEPVSILVDADAGEPQEVSVALGTPMTIRVRASASEEFHLHGYDLELSGTDVTFNFVADKLGDFELETHGSGTLVLILKVFED